MAYHPYPLSLDPLPQNLRPGLIVIASLALLSLVTTAGAISFIIFRLFISKQEVRHGTNRKALRFNQPIILILNLLIADFQQAMSFAISLHWINKNAILSPTAACSVQAWLVQVGDVTSGMFSLAIAGQTFYVIVLQRTLEYHKFTWAVIGVWAFCIFISLLSPLIHRSDELFVSAGAWCWIGENYKADRLFIHYLWIFICEFGSLVLYAVIFVVLRRNLVKMSLAAGHQHSHKRIVDRVARLMLVYPIAYTMLTLPLAVHRMSNGVFGSTFLLIAGACMTSCGWVDVLLYMVTRRTIVRLHAQSISDPHSNPVGGINLNRAGYGNVTTVTRTTELPHDTPSSSQERFVKLEQSVQVTVERARPESEEAAVYGPGNSKPLRKVGSFHGDYRW